MYCSSNVILFQDNQDAVKFSEMIAQKYRIENNQIIFESNFDYTALKTISKLTEINFIVEKAVCLLKPSDSEWNRRESNSENSIYVTDLAAYNHGMLHGIWLDCDRVLTALRDRDESEVLEDIKWMLSWSPVRHLECCEEWAIHDYEGFGGYQAREWENIGTLTEIAQNISEHGKAYGVYLSDYNQNGTPEEFKEYYRGEWNSVLEYIQDYFDQCGYLDDIPESIINYLDWDAIVRDWKINSIDAFENGKTVFIFDK